ncbi:hypothetical protein [Aeromicrobium choanae]|uniref:hypothetical protein n=1 Tax=Aeromicrobium choanae TaxID=1736691 RepID=UPI00129484AA|nr:hypothetical protein [Aeromicrobium choanae]
MEAVYEQWPHLTHAEHRVLVRMALVAPDKVRTPAYWAGWKLLAFALGCDMPAEYDETPEAERLRTNAKRSVARVVSGLEAAGAIERVRRGRLGVQAEYRLNLRPVDKSRYGDLAG